MESQQDWYAPLRSLTSRGSKTEVKGGLAGLHDARREHLGQFFTPDAIAAFMFGLVKHELDREAKHGKVSLLDTSVGSGRLLQFCDPAIHKAFHTLLTAVRLQPPDATTPAFAGVVSSHDQVFDRVDQPVEASAHHSTVTDLARLRGLSTSVPLTRAAW